MKYDVRWNKEAVQRLAHAWNNAEDRNSITQAVRIADKELAIDADKKGEDYFGDRYIVPLRVLWVLFQVDVENGAVEILQVGREGHDLPHDDIPAIDSDDLLEG